MKKTSLEDLELMGSQAKKVREELIKLHQLSVGKMPVSVNDHILKAINQLDSFRCKAEDRMFELGVSEDLKIFYR